MLMHVLRLRVYASVRVMLMHVLRRRVMLMHVLRLRVMLMHALNDAVHLRLDIVCLCIPRVGVHVRHRVSEDIGRLRVLRMHRVCVRQCGHERHNVSVCVHQECVLVYIMCSRATSCERVRHRVSVCDIVCNIVRDIMGLCAHRVTCVCVQNRV
jgi:hypothetical protein